jgi:hypothetical protein
MCESDVEKLIHSLAFTGLLRALLNLLPWFVEKGLIRSGFRLKYPVLKMASDFQYTIRDRQCSGSHFPTLCNAFPARRELNRTPIFLNMIKTPII